MINLITGISVVVIAFVTAAMVVVLSAFNGIDALVDDLYSSFDGDIIIGPERGKSIPMDSLDLDAIQALDGYLVHHEVIEENVLLTFGDRQRVAKMKGVPDGYLKATGLDESIFQGSDLLSDEESFRAILGYKVMLELDAGLFSETLQPLIVNAPRMGKKISRSREKAFQSEGIMVGGIFSINMEYDSEYFLVPIDFARDIMDYFGRSTFIEVEVEEDINLEEFQRELTAMLAPGIIATTRYEKNAVIYKANESERLVTILILSFIILIAVFNILASLTMLMLDKQHDLSMLHSMGAPVKTLRRIFFLEGMLISGLGAIIGLGVGILLCYLQDTVGLVRLQGGIVDFYPVIIKLRDVVMVFCIVMAIALAFSWIPVNRMTRSMIVEASDRKR
ncbi:MAG: ABC transporter permease [Flavobacteriales bacterium]|nr:ABC transporter permease [Flavobacteriales bacterium]